MWLYYVYSLNKLAKYFRDISFRKTFVKVLMICKIHFLFRRVIEFKDNYMLIICAVYFIGTF